MRPKFRQALESYGEIAKDRRDAERAPEAEGGGSSEELGRLDAALDWLTAKRARASMTDQEVQQEIYALQERKQAIMAEMRGELSALDDPARATEGERRPDARPVVTRDGTFFCRSRKTGQETEVTLGDMVTDLAWDIDYELDGQAPREVRKRLIIERAKRQLEDLLDRQIATEESANARTGERVKEAYRRSMDARESGELPFGLVAERILSQMLRKAIIDRGAPFTYRRADAFQDVTQKIDFIVRRVDHARGVRVEEGESLGATGIQFTLNPNPDVLERKAQQIARSKELLQEEDHIDDIVLVRMAADVFGRAYERWERLRRPPGGPDALIDERDRDAILRELLKGMEAEA